MKHEMKHEITRSDGAMEYRCQICGRRILLNDPAISLANRGMVVIDEGDHNASHYVSIGGLEIKSVQIE